ncbi:MAG: hypothetical protein NZO41_04295 [Candidatus Bipolaricaulota bacterium]|nr:hypothetical protein [Candidatus Bipolaricaulota bacterium]MDW8141382.1 hypothetical protein [Candidatus Bipolaricaulota bacterium]
MDRVEAALEQLAQAQARSEQRVERLEAAVEKLAQAQARTEQRVERLEAAVEKLAQAQARTEQALQQLATQVGALADNVGYGLEDIARVVLPGYLKYRYGITVERLERRIFHVDGQVLDVDLYAEGRQQKRRVVVLGEVKSRIYAREVGQFQKLLQLIQPQLPAKPLPVMFGYFIDLSAMEAAQEEILLIASYQPAVELSPGSSPKRRRTRRARA